MDDQPSRPRNPIPTWAWIVAIFAIILVVQLIWTGRFRGPEEISLSQVANYLLDEQVQEISVTGNKLEVTLDNGSVVNSVKDEGSIFDQLASLGVSEEI